MLNILNLVLNLISNKHPSLEKNDSVFFVCVHATHASAYSTLSLEIFDYFEKPRIYYNLFKYEKQNRVSERNSYSFHISIKPLTILGLIGRVWYRYVAIIIHTISATLSR